MDKQKIEEVYTKLAELVAAGKEEEARTYLGEHLAELPENLRNEIGFEMFINAIEEEAVEKETIARIQEEGVTAVEFLEKARAQIKSEDAPTV